MEFAIDAEVRGLKQCRTEDEECGPNVKLSRTGSLSLCRQEDATGNATDQDSGVLQDPQLIMYNQQLQQMRHLQSYAYGNALKQSHFASSGHLQQQQLFPFTASQWAELEHQALIFKYMMARAPVPPELVVPIRRSLILSPHTNTAWSGFQLGVSSGSPMDAEPGRCRRTDGKKWRCSRPVVADQKYCERHMHRGRNRSRKAAEAAAANNGSTNGTAKASFHSEKQQQSGKSSGSFNSGIESGLSHYGSQLAASKDQRFVSNDLHPEQLLFSEVSGSCTRRLGAALPYLSQSYSSSMIPTSSLFHSGLESSTGKQVEAPLRHFFDDWPRSKNNQSPWSCEQQGIVNGGLKLGLEEDQGKANSASAREEEEEDTYRMSGGSDLLADVLKTSSGSDYQRKKLVLASPTGVLQKVTCFSDSSSSASSPGSVKNTHAD